MSRYDTAVILGYRPLNGETWQPPTHITNSLDRSVELFNEGSIQSITVSGNRTINFDVLNIAQPFKECDKMAKYLLTNCIPDDAIQRESESKDTISNIYYLKRQILMPRELRNLLFIAAESRLERIKFLCERILGSEYRLDFEPVEYKPEEVSQNEQLTFAEQSDFLAPMKDGDDAWLEGKFYDDPYYVAVKNRVVERAADEPLLYLANPAWRPAE
ncbi:MAG: YdcF family protein [bacterium]|nr:YdcF family protein [bacterium]